MNNTDSIKYPTPPQFPLVGAEQSVGAFSGTELVIRVRAEEEPMRSEYWLFRGTEQIYKINELKIMRSRFLTVEDGSYKYRKGECQKLHCSTKLELEMLVWNHGFSIYINRNRYCCMWTCVGVCI